MGLDIYLYKYNNKPETDRIEEEYETFSQKNWDEAGEYDSLTQEQKDSINEKNDSFAKSLGLGKYGEDETNKIKIEIDSALDKEHYFKIGYFRSSYNGGGINMILQNLNVPSLKEIFDYADEYCFQPDWNTALQKCNESINLLEAKGNYRCFQVSPNIFGQSTTCNSEKEALEIFAAEKLSGGSFDNYSNNKGEFYQKEPLKVLALIQGMRNFIGRDIPCTYVVFEGENQWYVTALKIVKETIEYVLNQSDKDKYYLHWSS